MTDAMRDVDALGDMISGSLLAGAVEPGAGHPGRAGDGRCRNCQAALAGAYCSHCGQKAELHRSLRGFFGDFVSGLFNFEGKIWHTIPMLAWKPGELTRRYIDGERARFVSPIALYLFTVFVMFAVLGFTGTLSTNNFTQGAGLERGLKEGRADLADLQTKRQQQLRDHSDLTEIDRRIAAKVEDISTMERIRAGQVIVADENDGDNLPPWLMRSMRRVQADPKGAFTNVQEATSKFSWLLIPLSIPFLWLLFPFSRRFRMYDHSVFVTYSLSFMMSLVIVGGLLVWAGMPSIGSILFLLPPIHMYRQLKGAYGLTWYGALLRTVALVSFAFVAAVLFAIAMVAIGIL